MILVYDGLKKFDFIVGFKYVLKEFWFDIISFLIVERINFF